MAEQALIGTSTHIVALNMYQWIDRGIEEQRDPNRPAFDYRFRFDQMRGQRGFTEVLNEKWYQRIVEKTKPEARYFDPLDADERISPADRVAFATCLFRKRMLQRHYSPQYRVKLDAILKDVLADPRYKLMARDDDSQFNLLCQDFLGADPFWKVDVRPTVSGIMIVRFVHSSHDNGDSPYMVKELWRKLSDLWQVFDVTDLAEQNRKKSIKELEVEARNDAHMALYCWLRMNMGAVGSSASHKSEEPDLMPRYAYPVDLVTVRMQIATTIARRFLSAVTDEFKGESGFLCINTERRSTASALEKSYPQDDDLITKFNLHDEADAPILEAYTIHNIHKIIMSNGEAVDPNTITQAGAMRNECRDLIARLLETSKLGPSESPQSIKPKDIDALFASDLATWQNEICLLSVQDALIWVAPEIADKVIGKFVRNTATNHRTDYHYADYWLAMERLIEFVVEIRMLAQVIDMASERVVDEIVAALNQTREGMAQGDIKLRHEKLILLSSKAANVSRMTSMCQSLSIPNSWCNVDTGVTKANYLMDKLDVPHFIHDIEFDAETLVNLVNHMDDLYLADLAEEGNRRSTRLSISFGTLGAILATLAIASYVSDVIDIGRVNESLNVATQCAILIGLLIVLFAFFYAVNLNFGTWIRERTKEFNAK